MDLQIGITDLCNYRCIMCMQQAHLGLYGASHIKTSVLHNGCKGFIDKETLRNIMEKTSEYDFRLLKLQWLGESFIHPQFSQLIKIINEYENYERIVFTTNLSVFSEDILKSIEENKKDIQIIISLDAISPEIYEKIKGVDKFSSVMQNMDLLMKNKNKISVVFQSIIMDENHNQAENFIDYLVNKYNIKKMIWDEYKVYSEKEDCIFFKRLGAYDQKNYEKLHKEVYEKINEKLEGRLITSQSVFEYNDKNREVCTALFRTPTFNWDGRMTFCCMDSELENSPGNINENDFESLWNGEYAEKIRNAHFLKDFTFSDRCGRCGNLDDIPLTEDEKKSFGYKL